MKRLLTAPELVRATRRGLGVSSQAFANAVGVESGRTVRRWEAGLLNVPGPVLTLCWIWRRGDCPPWAKPPEMVPVEVGE